METYLPVCTNDEIFLLMPWSKTSLILLTSSLDVFLLENSVMFELFKDPNTGQYVYSTTNWYRGCFVCETPGVQGFSNMEVHAPHF